MKSFILFIFLQSIFLSSFSQQCGSDYLLNKERQKLPGKSEAEAVVNQLIYTRVQYPVNRQAANVLVVPVVFHVIHNNGPENVPDNNLLLALYELNLRFQNQGPYYDSTGHLVNVEFCLASVNPSGSFTTGINRAQSALTVSSMGDQFALKNISRWSPHLYLNIWVVRTITDNLVDGYASFPFQAGNAEDGIVVEYQYINNNYLLAHEAGHYLGLYHTFEGACMNYNCLLNGDFVCDTPPDNSFNFACMDNTCFTDLDDTTGFNPFTADVNQLPNYMDYTVCPLSFSQGQADRMYHMTDTIRHWLKLSNGCAANPGQPLPVAAFTFQVLPCNEGKVFFSSLNSMNTLTSEWDLDGDGTYDLLGDTFTYVYPASGIYTVRLRVTGIGGQDSTFQSVTVYNGGGYYFPIVWFLGITPDSLNYYSVCQGRQISFTGSAAGATYQWSSGQTATSISFAADSSFDMILTMTDTNGYTWDNQCHPIHIRVHPLNQPAAAAVDTLGYFCEGTPVKLYVQNPVAGQYEWFQYHVLTGWQSTGVFDTVLWVNADPVYGNQYYVKLISAPACFDSSNFILVHPKYLLLPAGFSLQVNGNNLSAPVVLPSSYQWYRNDTLIIGATIPTYTVVTDGCYRVEVFDPLFPACVSGSDTVCFPFTTIAGEQELMFKVYAVSGYLYRIVNQYNYIHNLQLFLYDANGRIVQSQSLISGSNEINLFPLANGLYQAVIKSDDGQVYISRLLRQ